MQKKVNISLLFLGIILLMVSQTFAASTVKDAYYENPLETRTFNEKSWKDAIGKIDYTPEAVKKKKEKEKDATDNAGNTNGGNNNRNTRDYSGWDWNVGSGALSGFFKLLLIVGGIGLLSFIVYKMAGGSMGTLSGSKDTKGTISSNVDIAHVEQNLHKSDMEILIEKTLEEGNYMMVIRLYYLWGIKELSNKHLIKWKRDKTNRDYARELSKTGLQKPFREVTRIFERVWYGNQKELGQGDFKPLQTKLQDFVDTVKKK